MPALARRLNIPLRTIEPEPWSSASASAKNPRACTATTSPRAAAAGTPIGDLPLPEGAWISFIVRDGHLVPAQAETVLRAADEVLVLAPGKDEPGLRELFGS